MATTRRHRVDRFQPDLDHANVGKRAPPQQGARGFIQSGASSFFVPKIVRRGSDLFAGTVLKRPAGAGADVYKRQLLASRLTATAETPSTLATLFSTWAEQAEQVMPVTSNFCFMAAFLSMVPHPGGVLISKPSIHLHRANVNRFGVVLFCTFSLRGSAVWGPAMRGMGPGGEKGAKSGPARRGGPALSAYRASFQTGHSTFCTFCRCRRGRGRCGRSSFCAPAPWRPSRRRTGWWRASSPPRAWAPPGS